MIVNFFILAWVNCLFASESSFSGFYVGKQLGGNAIIAAAKKTSVINLPGENDKFKSKVGLGNSGLLVGWFAGYGKLIDAWYVGAEVYYNICHNQLMIFKTNAASERVNNTNNAGAKVRVGYGWRDDIMFYACVGQEYSKWQLKKKSSNASDETAKMNAPNMHFVYGLGIESFVNQQLFLRGEYGYVRGPKIDITTTKDPVTLTTKLAADQHRFTLGVGFRF